MTKAFAGIKQALAQATLLFYSKPDVHTNLHNDQQI